MSRASGSCRYQIVCRVHRLPRESSGQGQQVLVVHHDAQPARGRLGQASPCVAGGRGDQLSPLFAGRVHPAADQGVQFDAP